MASIQNYVGSTLDFQGLASLKRSGEKTAEEARQINAKVAAEFESMFLKQITDSMQKSLKPLKSDLLNNDSMELFEGMFYDEVAHKIAYSQGLGLVDWLNDISEKREGLKDGALSAPLELKDRYLKSNDYNQKVDITFFDLKE